MDYNWRNAKNLSQEDQFKQHIEETKTKKSLDLSIKHVLSKEGYVTGLLHTQSFASNSLIKKTKIRGSVISIPQVKPSLSGVKMRGQKRSPSIKKFQYKNQKFVKDSRTQKNLLIQQIMVISELVNSQRAVGEQTSRFNSTIITSLRNSPRDNEIQEKKIQMPIIRATNVPKLMQNNKKNALDPYFKDYKPVKYQVQKKSQSNMDRIFQMFPPESVLKKP